MYHFFIYRCSIYHKSLFATSFVFVVSFIFCRMEEKGGQFPCCLDTFSLLQIFFNPFVAVCHLLYVASVIQGRSLKCSKWILPSPPAVPHSLTGCLLSSKIQGGCRVVKEGLIFVKNLFGSLFNHSPREPECACRHDIAKIHVYPLIFY